LLGKLISYCETAAVDRLDTFAEKLRNVIDQRVMFISAMLCPQPWRTSPDKW
jgi:hypothetical protein